MRRHWKLSFGLLLAVFVTVSFVWLTNTRAIAANPTTISFQGKVVNANGTNVADGTYGFVFKLYTVSSGGTAIWTETDSSVSVTAGVFQVSLGAGCPFFTANACNGSTPINFANSNSLYLGITFNSDPAGEMSPRVQLQSVPFAYQADNASNLGGIAASNYVQLSPSGQQTGNINISGSGTLAGGLTVSNGASSLTGASGGSSTALAIATGAASNIGLTIQGASSQSSDFLDINNSGSTNLLKVDSSGRLGLGLGATAAAYQFDLRGNAASQIHLSTSSTDTGGYLLGNSNDLFITGGSEYNGTNWIAKNTTAAHLAVMGDSGALLFSSNSGLTVGNTFGPTLVFQVSATGAIAAATSTNTINNLIINNGNLSGVTGYTQGSGTFSQTYSSGVTGAATTHNATNSNTSATAATVSGVAIALTGTNNANAGANTLNAINLSNVTAATNNTFNALNVGTGYTNLLQSANVTITAAGAVTAGTYNGQTVSSAASFTGTVNAVTGYKINGTSGVNIGACTNSQAVVSMHVTGGIVVGGTCGNDAALSDERLKININPIDDTVLDNIKNVNTVTFNYDCSLQYWTISNTYCDSTLYAGVLAQQLMQIFPGLVHQDQYGYYSVDYRGLSIYTLKAVTQLAQHFDSSGNANLNVVTANRLNVNGDLRVNGNLNYASVSSPNGDFSNSVVTPRLLSSGALFINSGQGTDVSIDTASANNINIGTTNAATVDISNANGTTNVKGAFVAEGPASFGGPIIAKGGSLKIFNNSGVEVVSFDNNGDANFAGNLNLASASLTGGLSVGGDFNVAGLSTFQKLATFLGKTIFRQNIELDGHLTVDADTAGYAQLKLGEQTVHVNFANAYNNPPIVSANITNGQFEAYTLNNVTTTGFDINLLAPARADTTFSWVALGVNNPVTAVNASTVTSPTP